jgi:hypothetical protein
VNAAELIAAVHAAALERWSNDVALVTHLGGPWVFQGRFPDWNEEVDGPEPTRYVLIGERTATLPSPMRVMAGRGSSVTMATGAWTRGELDEGAVMETVRLMNASAATTLLLPGFGAAFLENEFTAVLPNPDPALHHAPARYRINSFATA